MQRPHQIFLKTLLVLSLLLLAGLAQAETLYVQASSASIRSGKTSLSKIVASVQFAEALESIQQEGNWYQVRTHKGHVGWIYTNKVTSTKPSTPDSRFASIGRGFRKTESSSATATAGVRGLDEFSSGYAKRKGISRRHRVAVNQMTHYRLSDRDVEMFLKSGRLGEYAE